jgi:hypothetical protein
LESSRQTRGGGCGEEDRAARIFPDEIVEQEKEKKRWQNGVLLEERIGVFLAADRLQASELRLVTGKAEEGKQQQKQRKKIQNWRGPPPP